MKYPPGWYPTQKWLEERDMKIKAKREMIDAGTYASETKKRLKALERQIEISLEDENRSDVKEELKKAFISLQEILCVEIYQ